MTEEREGYDVKTARAALEADGQRRVLAAKAEIEAALEKYSCTLEVSPVLTPDGKVAAVAKIVPR